MHQFDWIRWKIYTHPVCKCMLFEKQPISFGFHFNSIRWIRIEWPQNYPHKNVHIYTQNSLIFVLRLLLLLFADSTFLHRREKKSVWVCEYFVPCFFFTHLWVIHKSINWSVYKTRLVCVRVMHKGHSIFILIMKYESIFAAPTPIKKNKFEFINQNRRTALKQYDQLHTDSSDLVGVRMRNKTTNSFIAYAKEWPLQKRARKKCRSENWIKKTPWTCTVHTSTRIIIIYNMSIW